MYVYHHSSLASVKKGNYKVCRNVAPPVKDICAAHCTPATIAVTKSLPSLSFVGGAIEAYICNAFSQCTSVHPCLLTAVIAVHNHSLLSIDTLSGDRTLRPIV